MECLFLNHLGTTTQIVEDRERLRTMHYSRTRFQSRSKSRIGFPMGASLAFFICSSNFFARMSSLLVSWNQESANLSSRCCFCFSRMFAACVRSTSGPGFTCASCDNTAPNTGSITSLAWQHGHVTFRFSPSFNPMALLYSCAVKNKGREFLAPVVL